MYDSPPEEVVSSGDNSGEVLSSSGNSTKKCSDIVLPSTKIGKCCVRNDNEAPECLFCDLESGGHCVSPSESCDRVVREDECDNLDTQHRNKNTQQINADDDTSQSDDGGDDALQQGAFVQINP